MALLASADRLSPCTRKISRASCSSRARPMMFFFLFSPARSTLLRFQDKAHAKNTSARHLEKRPESCRFLLTLKGRHAAKPARGGLSGSLVPEKDRLWVGPRLSTRCTLVPREHSHASENVGASVILNFRQTAGRNKYARDAHPLRAPPFLVCSGPMMPAPKDDYSYSYSYTYMM